MYKLISQRDFQNRVWIWFKDIFPAQKYCSFKQRSCRFFEEAIELVQSLGMKRSDCHYLIDIIFDRRKGIPQEEVGGVLVTLATLCEVCGINMMGWAEVELERISKPEIIEKIKEKQREKDARKL